MTERPENIYPWDVMEQMIGKRVIAMGKRRDYIGKLVGYDGRDHVVLDDARVVSRENDTALDTLGIGRVVVCGCDIRLATEREKESSP